MFDQYVGHAVIVTVSHPNAQPMLVGGTLEAVADVLVLGGKALVVATASTTRGDDFDETLIIPVANVDDIDLL